MNDLNARIKNLQSKKAQSDDGVPRKKAQDIFYERAHEDIRRGFYIPKDVDDAIAHYHYHHRDMSRSAIVTEALKEWLGARGSYGGHKNE